MTTNRLESISQNIQSSLADKLVSLDQQLGELTIVVQAKDVLSVCKDLRDNANLSFDTLIDLCGVDYSAYEEDQSPETCAQGKRFAAVYHLLSIKHNCRLRVKAFAEDNVLPIIDSVNDIWPAVNWFEREAFDLYGIVFPGHPDLRRILTDYGFIGNPFRKDFPISGNVEMRYDEEQKRVIYQPVSIEPREITPHIVREENYGDSH